MLVITRKTTEKIIIGDNIEITILEVGRKRVRLGINAPKQIVIHSELGKNPPSEAEPEAEAAADLRPRDVA